MLIEFYEVISVTIFLVIWLKQSLYQPNCRNKELFDKLMKYRGFKDLPD